MRCPEFLTLYSDYRDGVIAEIAVRRRLREHLNQCARCRRYDTVIRRGVAMLRGTELEGPAWVPSDLVHEEPLEPAPARYAGALVLLAALSLLVWEGRGTPDEREAVTRPVAIANPGLPFVRFAASTPSDPAPEPDPTPVDPDISPQLTLYPPPSDR